MSLAPGTLLGPYEIVAPLGAGGMGEVYRAKDSRLGREVAIKVLPQHLSKNVEIRARFEREAKTVSSLNHPHICVLHDVGRAGDIDYLVMELVEGETLARRLAKGPLPPAEVLKLGAQIADALDRAHRAGVVHRDLKPANVMLTRSGAKLMDFGLARAIGLSSQAQSGASPTLAQSPTVAEPLTAEGTIIGTFQYMAPEQLEGREADARSDLWALGCVLYEMATGQRAFEGSSQASLIGAIMRGAPRSISELAPLSPPGLDRLVGALLAKDPDDRIQTAHDAKLQLEWSGASTGPISGISMAPMAGVSRRPPWMIVGIVAGVTAAVTALAMSFLSRGRPESPRHAGPHRYVLGSANLQTQASPKLSPDGTYAVFSVREGDTPRVYRRNLASFDMTPIPGTEGGTAPFFSPDGAWIGFGTPEAIKKVPEAGGIAQVIYPEGASDAGYWSKDGTIYFCPRNGGGDGLTALLRVPQTGGKAEVVARLDTTAAEMEAWLPELLPDGKTVILSIIGLTWRLVAVRADGFRQTVVENAACGRYIPSGYLLYYDFDSEAVLAAPFDPAAVRITGPAFPLTEEVDALHCFDVGADGTLLYVPKPGAGAGNEVVWLDRKGKVEPITDERGQWAQPRVSPDGKRILLRKVGTNCELWMFDAERGALTRIVHGGDNHSPVWSPDGRRFVYQRNSPPEAMISVTVEGARETQTLPAGTPESWSAGGNLLAYTVTGRTTQGDIWVRAMDGSSPAVSFLATPHDEDDPSLSPDGKWIAYVSDETGIKEVLIRSYPDTGISWQVSTGGGGSPLWSRDGRQLYFTTGAKMMVVSIETRPTLTMGLPVVVFDGNFDAVRSRDFDVAPDGRFAIPRRASGMAQNEMRILLNWEKGLERTARATH